MRSPWLPYHIGLGRRGPDFRVGVEASTISGTGGGSACRQPCQPLRIRFRAVS
jgi:hypothetical protein